MLQKLIAESQTPAAGPSADAGQVDAVAKLRELADLRGQGLLTEAEFETMKARVISGQ